MREFSIIKQNILKFLEFKGVSKYEFYQKTGTSNGILSQKNGLSEENIFKFLSYYSEVSPEWLLTGKGNMLKEEVVKENVLREPEENYGLDYKEMYLDAKYTIEIQKKYIESLEQQLNTKRKAG